jgi:hypothetical protein
MKLLARRPAVVSLALLCCWACGSPAAAQLLYDGFDYPAGESLDGKGGGSGLWSATWASVAGQQGIQSVTDPAGALSYPGLAASGNAIQDIDAAQNRAAARAWNTAGFTDGGDVLWYSVLFNTSATASDIKVLIVGTGDPNNNGVGLQANGNTSGVFARVANTNSGTSLPYTAGQTTLVVGRVTFSDTAGQDESRLWVNPPLGAPPPDATGVAVLGDIPAGSMLTMRGGGAWTGTMDEMRVGETFASVTVPEPAAAMLFAPLAGLLWRRQRSR